MASKTYKCAFKYCKHDSCEIPQESAVQVGARYMHKDCAEKSEYMLKTRDLYYEKVSKTVVMKVLVKTINDLVVKKDVDPRYLYFALDFAIANKIPIKSPYSLHYLADNNRIKELWAKKQAAEIARQIKEETRNEEPVVQKNNSFNYTANKTVGFGGILGGK